MTIDNGPAKRLLVCVKSNLYKGMPEHVRKLRDSAAKQKRLKDRRDFKARQQQAQAPSKLPGY